MKTRAREIALKFTSGRGPFGQKFQAKLTGGGKKSILKGPIISRTPLYCIIKRFRENFLPVVRGQ